MSSNNPFSDPSTGSNLQAKQSGKGSATAKNPFDDPNLGVEPSRSAGDYVRDVGAWGLKAALAVPETVVGLADLATGGKVGKALENEGGSFGLRFKQAREVANDMHSDATKLAQQKFQDADGIWDKTAVAVQNPSLVVGSIAESMGLMGAGGVIGRGLMAGTRLGQMGAKGAAMAGAAGEGVVGAGSAAEQIRQETDDGLLTGKQAGLAAATGLATGALGFAGNKVANRLGIGDADMMMAQGKKGMAKDAAERATAAAVNPLAQPAQKSILRQMGEGAIAEGVLEELPQSVSEQILQNEALGKPWSDGLDEAVVMGILSGGAMGAGAAGYRGFTDKKIRDAVKAQQEAAAASGAPGADAKPADAKPADANWTTSAGAAGEVQPGTAPASDANAPNLDYETLPGAAAESVGNEIPFDREFDTGGLSLQSTEPVAVPPVLDHEALREKTGLVMPAQLDTGRIEVDTGLAPLSNAAPARQWDTGNLSLVGDAQPQQQVPLSQRMGLNPNAGALSKAAVMAVDSGASPVVQSQSAPAAAQPPVQQQAAPEVPAGVDPDTGEITLQAQIEEIKSRIAYMQQQGAAQGWNKEMVAQRNALQTQLTKLEVQAAKGSKQGASTTGAPAPAALTGITQILAKQIPDMSAGELQQAIAHYGPNHKRTKKLQKALQALAQKPLTAIESGAKSNGTQTNQAQQSGAQPAQTGAAQASAPATQSAAQGVATNATPAQHDGAQAPVAPSAKSQAASPQAAPAKQVSAAKSIAMEGNARREQERQRQLDASERWTRMTTVERQAVAGNAPGLNAIARKNLHTRAWADIGEKTRAKLVESLANTTTGNAAQAPTAIKSAANNAPETPASQTPVKQEAQPISSAEGKAETFSSAKERIAKLRQEVENTPQYLPLEGAVVEKLEDSTMGIDGHGWYVVKEGQKISGKYRQRVEAIHAMEGMRGPVNPERERLTKELDDAIELAKKLREANSQSDSGSASTPDKSVYGGSTKKQDESAVAAAKDSGQAEAAGKDSEKQRWIKATLDKSRLNGPTGVQIDVAPNGGIVFKGDPNSSKDARALKANYDEAIKAGATPAEIAAALLAERQAKAQKPSAPAPTGVQQPPSSTKNVVQAGQTSPAGAKHAPQVHLTSVEDLTAALGSIARKIPIEVKGKEIRQRGRVIVTMPNAPASIEPVIAELGKALREAMAREGVTLPSNPADMTRDQFAIAYEFSGIIPQFELTSVDLNDGLLGSPGGMLTVDVDKLYDKIQAGAALDPGNLSMEQRDLGLQPMADVAAIQLATKAEASTIGVKNGVAKFRQGKHNGGHGFGEEYGSFDYLPQNRFTGSQFRISFNSLGQYQVIEFLRDETEKTSTGKFDKANWRADAIRIINEATGKASPSESLMQAAKDSGKLVMVTVGDKNPLEAANVAGVRAKWDGMTRKERLDVLAHAGLGTDTAGKSFDKIKPFGQGKITNSLQQLEKGEAAPKKKDTALGTNRNGFPLFEDANGVRYYVESGIRIQETVSMRPTAQGMQMARGELKPDFMTADESAEAGKPFQSAKPAPADTATKKDVAVHVPADIDAALTADMKKQKGRVKRLHTAAQADGMTLEEKKAAQLKVTAAEATLRSMRTRLFDAEDAAVAATKAGNPGPFSEFADLFPQANEALVQKLLSMPADPVDVQQAMRGAVSVSQLSDAGVEAVNEVLNSTDKPADYGSKNKLVSQSRADELRAKLREKAKNNMFGGLDTEMMAWGTELAVFHLEAGVRKFSDLVAAMARDLETTPVKLKPYLRSWYNGARDMMEDHGLSIEGMDNPETVRAELNKLDEQASEQEKETQDAGSAVHGNGAAPLEPVAAQDDAGAARAGAVEPRGAEGEQGSGAASGRPDAAGDAKARSGGNGAAGNDSVQTGAGGRGRGRVGAAKKAPRVRKGKNAAEELKADADEEIKQSSPVNVPGIDFTITDEVELGKGTESVKFADNLAAIRTLKAIEQENRRATPEEQRILARYVGWGGLKNAFRVAGAKREGNEGIAKGWEARVAQVEELLTPAELRAARNSTTAAHYTSQDIVNAVWKVVERFGYRGGAVLEPSVGTGNFIGLMPENLRGTSKVFAVEYDSLTARIAQLLYPNQAIVHAGFQEVPLPSGKFALAIGNPPFGKESLYFRHNPKLQGKSIHNQFFLQSLDALAENGVMGMVVSHNLMDAQDQSSRLAMAIDAELLGAIRLPDTAFKENARTEVVTDMLFFRKRTAHEQRLAAIAAAELRRGELDKKALAAMVEADQFDAELAKARAIAAEMQRWVPSSRQENFAGSGETISVNPFFLNNPKLVVGTMDASGTMNQRADLNVVLDNPAQMVERLNAAIETLPTREPVDGVAERTSAQFAQMATAMRLAVNRVEPGAVRRTQDGALLVAVEMDDVDSDNRKALLTELELTADLPFNTEYTLRSDGKWQREENVLDKDGKPVKKMKKDGSGPSNYNEKKIEVYDSLAAIDGKDKWGSERVAMVGDMLPLRDAFKRQMMLEASDAPAKMIEDNRKRLNNLYAAFKKKHGNLNKAKTAKAAMTMPDGALVLALEDVDKDGRTSPAAILSRRVTTPPQPVERVTSAGEAVAVVLAESGGIDIDRVAQLLGTDAEGAKAALSEGESPRAFFDPETQNWEPADGYLSGLVRRKLLAAKATGLEANVAALEKVQPEDWDATQITPSIGSSWIPAHVYVDFLKHLGFSGATAHYSKATNTFTVSAKGQARAEWRTSESGLDTDEIVQRLMNSRAMRVMQSDGKGGTVFDEEATAESQMKAGEISNEFMEWAFADDNRREELVQIFNERFNTRVMRQRDGSHLTLPGKVPDSVIKMRPWQLNAIWRGITDSSVLYDHAVGAGKTYTAIARVMERRRMGLSKKPMIVVPNHLVEQWAADVHKLYPGANVLAATKNDFEKQNRRRLFARIGAGDYDMVIVGHSSFGFIDIDPSTEERYLDEELRIAYAAVKEAEEAAEADGYSGFGKPMGVTQAERLVKKLEERLAKVRDNTRDRLLTFEEMGIDDLTVDEAHEFKNLAYSSNLQHTAGMGNKTGSQKALDLNLKIRSLKERPGTSTAFLTGTPISNSVAEMYLVLRNLMPAEMAEMGFENFDAWRINYVSATDAYEPTESGSLKEVTRLGREWSNMRSLMDLYYTVSDAVTLQDMKDDFAKANPGKSFPVPKVRSQIESGGDREMVAIKPTEQQRSILKDIVSGFNGLDGIQDRNERNAERLRLMDRARKVSLDARVVDPRIQVPDGTGKIGAVVDRVFQSYEKWNEDKGAQLIFLDRSVPKSKGDDKVLKAYDKLVGEWNKAREDGDEQEVANLEEKLQAYDANEMQELRAAQKGGWNAYAEIKRQLVAKGIPANEIRFVQEANTDPQKAELFRQVNAGEVRVLIGSTPRMGAGTNVQERLVALHHVDVTWKPSDIEQREGRIVRQNNMLLDKYGEDFTVDVIAYATEMTVDAKMWSLNATKLKAINGVRKYDGSFNMEFEDAESASMAEMAALATGNPLMVERVVLDGSIKKLEMAQRSFNRRLNGVRGQLRQAERTIEQGPSNAKRLRAFADAMEAKLQGVRERSDQRSVTVNGQRFDNEIDAMNAAVQSIEEQQKKAGNPKARYVVDIDGESVTSRERINAMLTERLGDAGFEAEANGKKVIDLGGAVRAIMEIHGDASKRGREYTLTGIQINGMPVELDVAPSRWRPDESTLTMAVLDADGVAMLTRHHDFGSPVLTGASLRAALPKMLTAMDPSAFRADADREERGVERAKRDLTDLKEQAAKTFPQEDELKQKRERLGEVVTLLKGSSDVSRLDDAPATEEGGTANFDGPAKRRPASAQDKAVMQAIAEGKSARDVLRVVASGSKDPFLRQVARLLLKSGITPNIEFGHIGKTDKGDPIHGQYRGKTDTIAIAGSAEYAAERIFMHEAMHAATMRALAKPGLARLQLQKLLEHVRKQKGAAGFYGIKNVDEFVAEVFTNPDFQAALRKMSAPSGSSAIKTAWDGFVRILRSILGLKNDPNNALSQALQLGVAAMREDMGLRQQGVRGEGAANFGTDNFSALKTSALDQLSKTFTHEGKVSLWDKSVGTMRHLAERAPAFKPVYEAASQNIDDVSMLANDAANMAPRILPRVESLRDIFGKARRKPVSVADNQAVAKPLFEGTLIWARDENGKPTLVDDLQKRYANLSAHNKAAMLLKHGKIDAGVLAMWKGLPAEQFEKLINSRFESKLLKPGIVWSDAELKSQFGATDNQISLYRETRAAIDRSIDMTARTDMLRVVGDKYEAMREAVLDQPSVEAAAQLLLDTLAQDAKADPDSADRLGLYMQQIKSRMETAADLQKAGYAPLTRFGRYTVDVVDANGERQYFGMYESKRESNLAKMQLASEFKGATITQGTMSAEAYKLFAGVTPETLEQFGEMLGLKADGNEAQDKAFQEFLKLTKNNHNAMKRLIHRKGVAGFSEDVGRVVASFVYSNARAGAMGLNAGKMDKAIGAIPKEQGELKDLAMGLRSYIRDPQEEGQAVRGMLFAQYLGGSIASAFVNMTQPFQVTMPWLSQYGGMKKASAQLARALKDMATKGHQYEADLAKALKDAEDDGTVSPQEVHQLMAQARGSGMLRSGDGTKAGDMRAKAGNLWEQGKVLWGQPFALAEQFNRRSTFIAAYRTAKDQGIANPAEFARRAVLETQFVYSKANKPRWARGAVGGTLFTFKTYSVSYLELMQRMWTQGGPEGKRAVGWALAMLVLMSGAGGLPFMEDAEDLIDSVGQMMGYNISSKQWRKELLASVVGAELGEFMEQGVSGLPGAPIDVSGRLGMGNLLPGTGLALEKKDRMRDLLEIAGPGGDLVARGLGGARDVLKGALTGDAATAGRGVMEWAPTAVRNAAKGIDMATSGMYKDTKGYKVIDTTLAEAVSKFAGFQPKSVADVQEANSFMLRSKSFYIQTSSEIKAQWADALFRKDEAAVQRVRERLARWNRDNPEQPIVVRMPDVWKRVREMGKDKQQRIADTAPKALREQMREMARTAG